MEAKDEFVIYREVIKFDCVRAISCWTIYKQIKNYVNSENQIINLSRAFFSNCLAAFLDIIVLKISNLLDKRDRRNLSLYKYMNFAKKEPNIFSRRGGVCLKAEVEKDVGRLRKYGQVIRDLAKRRDLTVAHTDAKHILKPIKIHEANPIIIGEVDELLSLIKEIFNRYSNYFDGNSYVLLPFNINDLEQTIELVKKGIKEEQIELGIV